MSASSKPIMWPDASTEFDTPPIPLAELRRSLSENNLGAMALAPSAPEPQPAGARGGNRSGRRRSKPIVGSKILQRGAVTTSPASSNSNGYWRRTSRTKYSYRQDPYTSIASAPTTPTHSRPVSPSEESHYSGGSGGASKPPFNRRSSASDLLAKAAELVAVRQHQRAAQAALRPTALCFGEVQVDPSSGALSIPEQPSNEPGRLWSQLAQSALLPRFVCMAARLATPAELEVIHFNHKAAATFSNTSLPASTNTSPGHSPPRENPDAEPSLSADLGAALTSARMMTGSIVDVGTNIVRGHFKNGVTLVQCPPAPMQAPDDALTHVSSVSAAIRILQTQLLVFRTLVIDLDMTQTSSAQLALSAGSNPTVMYMSMHHPPNPPEGLAGAAMHHAINIPWPEGHQITDAEFYAAFRTLFLPVAEKFAPDLILIIAGYADAESHGALSTNLSPQVFAHMTKTLTSVASGRVLMCLNDNGLPPTVAAGCEASIHALLGDVLPPLPDEQSVPSPDAVGLFQHVCAHYRTFWPILDATASQFGYSPCDFYRADMQTEELTRDATAALASLSMLSVLEQDVEDETDDDESMPQHSGAASAAGAAGGVSATLAGAAAALVSS